MLDGEIRVVHGFNGKPREVLTIWHKVEINDSFWDDEHKTYRRLSLAAEAPLGTPVEDVIYLAGDRLWKYEDGLIYPIRFAARPFSSLEHEKPQKHDPTQLVRRVATRGISRLSWDQKIQPIHQVPEAA